MPPSRPALNRLRHAASHAWVLALALVALALWQLHAAATGVRVSARTLAGTPLRIYQPEGAVLGPVVVIAHGFAGSQQLMQSFALTAARNGYVAVTFDFPGHGRNPAALTGSITEIDGATRTLLHSLSSVAAFARPLGDGRLAVLGHSMASDIVVRYAAQHPEVAGTIAVSMFSPAVTARTPRNLLVIVGAWEGMLIREGLRAVGLATAPEVAQADVVYGDFKAGTARALRIAPATEHVSVLFSLVSQQAMVDWLDRSFGVVRSAPPTAVGRGPWILLLLSGLVWLGAPLSRRLPRLSQVPRGASLPWRRLWFPLLLPMVGTPLLLRVLPTHFLPVLVADYLAVHFAVYGLLTWACLALLARRLPPAPAPAPLRPVPLGRLLVATAAGCAFSLLAVVWPIHSDFTCFVPSGQRVPLILAMLAGTLPYFLADGWMTRGADPAPCSALSSRLALLVSLAFAVALDFERLFFLIIIVPVILLFFLVYGLLSRWLYRATGHPAVGDGVCALALAWAVGVTFPLLAG